MKFLFIPFFLTLFALQTFAQKSDTIRIDASKVRPDVLKPGIHQYLVYFKNGKDSSRTNFQLWTREIQHTSFEGRQAIRINQVWEDNKTIVHKVNSICDAKDFAPIYHESWWNGRGNYTFDFTKKTMAFNDKPITESDTAKRAKAMYKAYQAALNQYVLNWHLDLEAFPILPYRDGATFMINFYDPGFPAPSLQAYTVTGRAKLTSYNGQDVDCWLLSHVTKGSSETFWVSKKSKEVLKLEQQFGNRYRFKVKTGFVAP